MANHYIIILFAHNSHYEYHALIICVAELGQPGKSEKFKKKIDVSYGHRSNQAFLIL